MVAVLTLDSETGRMLAAPEIVSRGFVYMRDSEELIAETKALLVKETRKFEGAEPRLATGGRYILTMSGRDRPGILKAVTVFLAEKGINVEDLFFRIDGENVTHIGELTIPRQLDIKQCQEELQALLAPMGLTGGLQHENLFRVTNEVGAIQTLIRENGNA